MSDLREKTPIVSDYEQTRESLASLEVQEEISKISTIEEEIDSKLGLAPNTKESTEAVDAFLIESAERSGSLPDDVETAVIAGALEISGERAIGENNPIEVLELDGHGGRIDDVIRELHEAHAILPNGEQAATLLAQEVDRVNSEYGLSEEVGVKREKTTGLPEFDRLDDYTPEFPEQILMHRSNAELSEGDIILPSNQISPQLYEELNKDRSFSSGSDPRKGEWTAGGYDGKLAHAGTRDFGEAYGKYLYVVEPLEGDMLKWGENFGADVNRFQKAGSPALKVSGELATTDSYTGKLLNEVVSTRGFRVVKKILHEPTYDKAMLPWPVSPDAVARHKARRENKLSNVAPPGSDTTPGYGHAYYVRTTSRKRPGKIGFVDTPGTYRAGADDQNPAGMRTKFDARKRHAENPGQSVLPGMSTSKYGDPDRWKPADVSWPEPPERPEEDVPLPGMENYTPPSPPVF